MSRKGLNVEIDGRGVARLAIARPAQANAFDGPLVRQMSELFGALDRDSSVRVVVLTGEGRAFSAGGDLAWMRQIHAGTRAERLAESRSVAEMLRVADTLAKPLVARVNGAAFGGGLGLIAVADVAVAAESARFAMSEVRVGLVAANIAPYLVRRMGPGAARRFGLSGRTFTGREALAAGLVHELVPDEELDAAVEREIAHLLEAAPEAVAATKRLIAYVAQHDDHDNMLYTADRLADAWDSPCGQEGIRAFAEKSVPSWRRAGS